MDNREVETFLVTVGNWVIIITTHCQSLITAAILWKEADYKLQSYLSSFGCLTFKTYLFTEVLLKMKFSIQLTNILYIQLKIRHDSLLGTAIVLPLLLLFVISSLNLTILYNYSIITLNVILNVKAI